MADGMRGGNGARILLRIVGGFAVLLALFGAYYHGLYLGADYSRRGNPPYFFQAWHIMASINIALLIASFIIGIQLIRARATWVGAFVATEALILLDAILPGFFWLQPRFGSSIAAASGIAGGTGAHLITLFPFWGSVAALWASRRIRSEAPSAAVV
jgi:hypothetical protein